MHRISHPRTNHFCTCAGRAFVLVFISLVRTRFKENKLVFSGYGIITKIEFDIGYFTQNMLTLWAPASLSVCKFSLHYPHKISCLVMRIKHMIIQSNLSEMKNKILPASVRDAKVRKVLGVWFNLSYRESMVGCIFSHKSMWIACKVIRRHVCW